MDLHGSSSRICSSYGDFEQRYDDNADEVGGIKEYVLTAYDSTMILGKAIAEYDEHHELTDSIEQVGTNYEGASGLINFLDNGDITGMVLTSVLTLETQMMKTDILQPFVLDDARKWYSRILSEKVITERPLGSA